MKIVHGGMRKQQRQIYTLYNSTQVEKHKAITASNTEVAQLLNTVIQPFQLDRNTYTHSWPLNFLVGHQQLAGGTQRGVDKKNKLHLRRPDQILIHEVSGWRMCASG